MGSDTDPNAVELFCICQKPYLEGQFMIECDKCNDWYHGNCVGIEEYQAPDIDVYHCPRCADIHGPLVLKKRRNVSRHNYKEINDGSKPIGAGTMPFIRQLKARKFASPDDILTCLPDGHELNADFLQEQGFQNPILISEKSGLGIIVPPSNFSIFDVEQNVGSMLELHVIDVSKQEDLRMKMREWTEYYNSTVRGKVLNVISLEFSGTNLADKVTAPEIVRNISWVDNVWPKKMPEDSPHTMPKVAKYCLMSVKDCFTDFHVDFGGTSVWYHVIRGEKVFYMIEPTDENLRKYQQWVSSSDQSEVFFGERVRKCYKVVLTSGNTFIIPTGWIHAVYTPKDSLVFGGNFLHSYNIEMQNRIYDMEKQLKTPGKFLFPNFEMVNWYAARNILSKMKDIHAAGLKLPLFLSRGVKGMIDVLKQWTAKRGELVKYHKMQVPCDINTTKLIKAIEKELKVDEGLPMSCAYQTGQVVCPSILSNNQKPSIKLKLAGRVRYASESLKITLPTSDQQKREKKTDVQSVQSDDENTTDPLIEELRKKRESLKLQKKMLKQSGHTSNNSSNSTSKKLEKKRKKAGAPNSNLNSSMKLLLSGDKVLRMNSKVKSPRYSSSDDDNHVAPDPIKLKLSLSVPNDAPEDKKLKNISPEKMKEEDLKLTDRDMATTGLMELALQAQQTQEDRSKQQQRSTPPVYKRRATTDIMAEIEAAKQDLFSNTAETKGLYFSHKSEDNSHHEKATPPQKPPPVSKKINLANIKEDLDSSQEDSGYVVHHLAKPKAVPVGSKRQREEEGSGTDSDYDPTQDSYYQDANFVYPRIDVNDDLDQDDYSWKPGQRKRIAMKKGKSKLNSLPNNNDTNSEVLDPFFAPDEELPVMKQARTSPDISPDINWQRGPGRPPVDTVKKETQAVSVNKLLKDPKKKGLKTAKQRLGKLLKLDKTGNRYVR